jgi:cell shape-determining protein MreC
LTIYAIEQNKDLTDLQNENTLLKSELEQLKRDLEEIKALLIKK